MQLPKWLLPCAALAVVLLLSCRPAALLGQNSHSKAKDLPTRITIGTHVLRRDVQRFGINLGSENFYDSGQILRNLVARNPGFQGQTWQSILRCTTFTRTACTAARMAWPASFLANGTFEVATGPAAGTRGTIRTSNVDGKAGAYTVQFASALAATPANGDYLIVRSRQPGDPTAGWWTSFECGATATAELHDLPPHSPGRQVLRIAAAKPCQRAALNSYFDSTPGHSFVHLNGAYTLRFQAKALTPNSTLQVRFSRESGPVYFNKTVPLQPGWHTYTLPFSATEEQTEKASTAGLSFTAASTSLLLADISLTADIVPAHHNPTAFRDEVVDTLRDLHPGILRYMDSGTDFGTSLDDWLTPPAGRPRTGYSLWATRQEDISLGLHEFLTLTQAVSTGQAPTEPWISLPAAFSPEEARHLIDYLAGPPTTTYGSLRARLGHPRPWTESFPRIHLELGNEVWNRGSFAGATIDDPAAYADRAATAFRAMRSAPAFTPARFDLVAGSFFEVPAHTAAEAVALHRSADTLSVAPYLFTRFNDATSTEAVFGTMLAQPEQWTTIGGLLRQQADAVRATSPATHFNLYEVNLGTVTGSPAISQADIDRTVPSTGAALAVADLMLLALRDLGVTEQCLFALTEFRNGFTSPGGSTARTAPLFGAVVDMGGATDRRRPSFYALRLLNQAILANLIETTTTGSDPTWAQSASPNDHIALPQAHLLQSFAFGEPGRRSLIVLNLSRTEALPVAYDGANAPRGTVQQTVLTSTHITDSNENEALVSPRTTSVRNFDLAVQHLLPPFSITAYTWKAP